MVCALDNITTQFAYRYCWLQTVQEEKLPNYVATASDLSTREKYFVDTYAESSGKPCGELLHFWNKFDC